MKRIVIYNSKTGFTKKYALWLKEILDAECCSFDEAKNLNFDDYDQIVFGGWICAGKVTKVDWFVERIPSWSDKKVAVFVVGGSPNENPDVDELLKNLLPASATNAKAFYCQGGISYENMGIGSKAVMKLLVKMLQSKKDASEGEKKMAELLSKSYDISDKKYLQPIVDWLQ